MRRLARLLPLSGALAAACWLGGVILLEAGGSVTAPDDPAEIQAYFADERSLILAATTVHGLGAFFFLWFLAALWMPLRGAPEALAWLRAAAFGGGVAAAALLAATLGGHSTGATTDVELLGAESSLVFWRLAHPFVVAAEVTAAVFVLAVSLLALARALLRRWVGWIGIPIALLLLVPPLAWLALLFLFPLWVALCAVLLFADGRRGASTV